MHYHWTKKDDKKMAIINIEDETDRTTMVVWANVLVNKNISSSLKVGNIF